MTKPDDFSARPLSSLTGATLALRHMPTAGSPRGVVQINHGLAEHAARYERFARFLADRGYHVYAHDHRGHGATRAPDSSPGTFARSDSAAKVIADVAAVHDHIGKVHPGLPVLTFGHSMGGLIALNFAQTHPDRSQGLAVWNSNFNAGPLGRVAQAILAVETFFMGSDVPSRMLPALTFSAWAKTIPNRRTDFDWLSRDPAEVDRYIADPLCGFDATIGMWKGVFQLIFSGGNADRISLLPRSLPVNLLGGGEDPATDKGKAVAWLAARMRAAGMSDVSFSLLPLTRHETLNETNRDDAMAEFATWADRVTAST